MGTSARIDELRKKFDENPRRYFAPLANEYRKAGDLDQAIFICQEYLPQQPGHMSGHIVYGQALYESGRQDEAKAVFETALSLDPENLIALKHLGDIARASGDTAGARNWYRRVLDADPRNDEIIELLSSLGPDSSQSAPSPVRERFTPLSNAVVETGPQADAPTAGAGTYGADGAEPSGIEKSDHALSTDFEFSARDEEPAAGPVSASGSEDIEMPSLPPSNPAPAATTADDDLLDLEDFSLGSVVVGATTPDEPLPEPSPIGLDGDVNISGGFTFGTDAGDFEADPFAIAGAPPSPDIELAADINLGLTDDSGSADTHEKLPPLSGLETFDAGVIASVPIEVPALETEAFFDLPSIDEGSSSTAANDDVIESAAESEMESPPIAAESASDHSAPIDGGHDGTEVPEPAVSAESAAVAEPAAEPAEVFVTETMAELYIQQGHLESALDIYRRLVEQRPDEPDLRDRLRAIEDRLFGTPAAASTDTTKTPAVSGPTIREFLVGLVSRRPANGGSSLADAAPADGSSERTSGESRMTPSATDTITGSIDALFSGAYKAVSDDDAANALAAAFASTPSEPEPHRPTPLPGTPAHRAQDELSLDHVFKSNTPAGESSPSNGFSFDQFFAEEMTDAGSESTGEPAPGSPEGTDDIAQFNAWLNGLKKT